MTRPSPGPIPQSLTRSYSHSLSPSPTHFLHDKYVRGKNLRSKLENGFIEIAGRHPCNNQSHRPEGSQPSGLLCI